MSRTLVIVAMVIALAQQATAQLNRTSPGNFGLNGTGRGTANQAGAKDLLRAQKMEEQIEKRFQLPNKRTGWVKGGSGSSSQRKPR